MRVDYQLSNKTWSYLHCNQFSVGSASEEYPLTVGGFTEGDLDRFAYHNRMKFSRLHQIMIMIRVVITVQLHIRVDGGTIILLSH